MNAQSGWDQEIDSAIAEYSIFNFKNSWIAFAVLRACVLWTAA